MTGRQEFLLLALWVPIRGEPRGEAGTARVAFGTSWTERLEGNRANGPADFRRRGALG
ncbi:MAG: hypothetical protein JWO67_6324 [Streptosporangiaceae bacterium]|nr:hypothetical protein [Streptosporangiaceae bacterium]